MTTPAPTLVAHRGHPRELPENTLEGIASAIEHGVRHVEFDVQRTADGVPVVIHDETIDRTAGVPGFVLDMPWSALAGVSVHEPARFGDRHAGARLPSLADMVRLLRGHPDVTAFVEIKRESLQRFGTAAVMDGVIPELSPLGDRAVVISFDHDAVVRARKHGARIGWVLDACDADHETRARALAPEFLFADQTRIPTTLWAGPWAWAVYTVDEPDVALELGGRGAAYVETNAIGAMLADARFGR